jgi:hypothetical protein
MDILCSHCLEVRIPPLHAFLFTSVEIEEARRTRSYVTCGVSGEKVAIADLSPELPSICSVEKVCFDHFIFNFLLLR